MRLIVSEDSVQVRLALWERVFGLMRSINLPRGDIVAASVVAEPVREAMRTGIKVGLRLPWLLYIARTIRLDQAFVVRRGAPGLSLAIRNHGTLTRVLVSTPEAEQLARSLAGEEMSPLALDSGTLSVQTTVTPPGYDKGGTGKDG